MLKLRLYFVHWVFGANVLVNRHVQLLFYLTNSCVRRAVDLVLCDVKFVMEWFGQLWMTRVRFIVSWKLKVTLGLITSFTEGLSHGVEKETINHMLFLWFLLFHNSVFDLFHDVFAFLISLCLKTSLLGAHKLLTPCYIALIITLKEAFIHTYCSGRQLKNHTVWNSVIRLRGFTFWLSYLIWNWYVVALWNI